MATKPIQSLSVDQQIEAFYIGYYGAAADSEGFAKWQAKYASLLAHESSDAALQKIADLIGASKETKETFPLLRDMPLNPHSGIEKAEAHAMVDTIYQNLFGVAPPAGDTQLTKLANEFLKGTETIGDVVLIIANGATGANLTAFENKVTVATDFTAATTAAGMGLPPTAAYLTEAKLVVADTTSDPTTVTTEENAINAWIAAGGGAGGQIFNLTTGIDSIDITTPGTYDTVNGVINQGFNQTGTTFTVGDTITGNGHTTVDIAVQSLGFFPFGTNAAQPVTMSGVSTVNILEGQPAGDLFVNAASWGSVNNINVSGFSDDVTIDHLNVSNGKGISLGINTTNKASIVATGVVSGLNYTAHVGSGVGVGSVAKFGTAGIDVTLGKGGHGQVELSNSVDHTAAQGDASVGSISIGHVNVHVGVSASAETVEIENYAEARSHNATVGNITVGDVSYTVATGGYGDFEVEQEALVAGSGKGDATVGSIVVGNIAMKGTGASASFYANVSNYVYNSHSGNALAGNVTVGNINVLGGKSADRTVYVSNVAYAHTGNATVGNINVGNVSFTGNNNEKFEADNYAKAYDTGNATVGNLTVGNLSMAGGAYDKVTAYVTNEAVAWKGVASAGNVAVGNLSLAGSDGAFGEVLNKANVSETGTATAGNIHLGAVAVSGHGTQDATIEVYNYATVDGGQGGAATVGNITVGNVSIAGATGLNYVEVSNAAHNYGSKSHNATVGDLTVGNITLTHNPTVVGKSGGTAEASFEQYAKADHGNATVGNISIGNINVNHAGLSVTGQTNAVAEVYVFNAAHASGAGGVATVGTVTVGNFTGFTGASGYQELLVTNEAKGNSSADKAGLVTIGNVSMQGAGKADMSLTVTEIANHGGAAAGITIGNVSIVGTKGSGSANLYNLALSGGSTGKVTVGNIALSDANVRMHISNHATSGIAGGISVGNITLNGHLDYKGGANSEQYVYQEGSLGTGNINVGNVTWTAKGAGAQTVYIENYATHGNAGTVGVGNVSFGAGAGQTNLLEVSNYAPINKVGAVTIGNVSIALASTNNATKAAEANFHVDTTAGVSGGSITAGNITIGSSGVTTKAVAAATMIGHVTISSQHGNVTVGNITVSGGVFNAAPADSDNLNAVGSTSAWLHLTAGVGDTITVGNVDYSGYASAATIDVSGYLGAANIIGSQGGSTITDNSGTNAINVSHTTLGDIIDLQESQTAVVDNGTVVTAAQTAVDSIIGFHSGDSIELASGSAAVAIGAAGTGLIQQGGASSYATFLLNAATQIHTDHQDAFAATVGGNTYVALANAAGHVGEIVEVTGVHTFTETAGVLHFLA